MSLGQRASCYGYSHGINLATQDACGKEKTDMIVLPDVQILIQMEGTARVGGRRDLLKAEIRNSE